MKLDSVCLVQFNKYDHFNHEGQHDETADRLG